MELLRFFAGTLNGQGHFAAFRPADFSHGLVQSHVFGVGGVNADDLVAAQNSGRFRRRSFDGGHDGQLFVLHAKYDADPAERSFGLQHQFTEHLGVHIDGVRIAERVHHSFDRAGQQVDAVDISDVVRFDGLDSPKQFQRGGQFVRTHFGKIIVDFHGGDFFRQGHGGGGFLSLFGPAGHRDDHQLNHYQGGNDLAKQGFLLNR